MIQLDKLEIGKRAIVEGIDLDIEIKKRFSNMGLSRGVILRVCRRTFGSDSLHVKLECSACIALSKSEAKYIKVTPITNHRAKEHPRFGIGKFCCQRDKKL